MMMICLLDGMFKSLAEEIDNGDWDVHQDTEMAMRNLIKKEDESKRSDVCVLNLYPYPPYSDWMPQNTNLFLGFRRTSTTKHPPDDITITVGSTEHVVKLGNKKGAFAFGNPYGRFPLPLICIRFVGVHMSVNSDKSTIGIVGVLMTPDTRRYMCMNGAISILKNDNGYVVYRTGSVQLTDIKLVGDGWSTNLMVHLPDLDELIDDIVSHRCESRTKAHPYPCTM
eukprot:363349-Chlamydomonas_euryale.AAC.6